MADISIWQKTGHFYFALTEEIPCILVSYFSHSIPGLGTIGTARRPFQRDTANV